MTDKFEEKIRELTEPINGQLPRPWMTGMKNPTEADVFIIGMNQSREYSAKDVTHRRHLDALFNKNGESCRGLYDERTKGKSSRTRPNIDRLVAHLNRQNIHNILETNVICYSTPMSAELRAQDHAGGAAKGEKIFRYLLEEIAPAVVIVHGVGTLKSISNILGIDRLTVPRSTHEMCDIQTEHHLIIPIRSLGLPEFNKWSSWLEGYLDKVAVRVGDKLAV